MQPERLRIVTPLPNSEAVFMIRVDSCGVAVLLVSEPGMPQPHAIGLIETMSTATKHLSKPSAHPHIHIP